MDEPRTRPKMKDCDLTVDRAKSMPAATDEEKRVRDYLNGQAWNGTEALAILNQARDALAAIQATKPEKEASFRTLTEAARRQCLKALGTVEDLYPKLKEAVEALGPRSDVKEELRSLREAEGRLAQLDRMEAYVSALRDMMILAKTDNPTQQTWAKLVTLLDTVSKWPRSNIHSSLDALFVKHKASLLQGVKANFIQTVQAAGWPASPITDLAKGEAAKKIFQDICAISEEDAIQALVVPLQQRFNYHFYGDRPTNQVDHPEWYIGYVRTIFTKQQAFLVYLGETPAMTERIVRKIESVVIDKFLSDVPDLSSRPSLMCRTIQQLAQFSQEMAEYYGFIDTGLKFDLKRVPIADSLADAIISAAISLASEASSWQLVHEDESDLDDLRHTTFHNCIEKHLSIFADTSGFLSVSCCDEFIGKAMVNPLLKICDILHDCVRKEERLDVRTRIGSVFYTLGTLVHTWLLRFPTVDQMYPVSSRMDAELTKALDSLTDQTLARIEYLLAIEDPVSTVLSEHLHIVQSNTPRSIFRRYFLRLVQKFDGLPSRMLVRPTPETFVRKAYAGIHSALNQFNPSAAPAALPRWEQIFFVVSMDKPTRDKLQQTIVDVAGGSPQTWRERAAEWRIGNLTTSEVSKALQNVLVNPIAH